MTTQVFLKDLFSSTVSGYWGSEAAASEVDVKIVRNGDIARDGSVRWDELPVRGLSEAEAKKASISDDDLLMTTSGECGRVALVRSDPVGVCTSNFVRRIRCDTTRTDPGFAYHLLRDRTIQREFARFTRGTTLQNLSLQKAFSSISVSLPPLGEQRRIASILDAADELRTKRQQAIAQLDTLTQATFYDMFGLPGDVGSEDISGKRGWKKMPLGDIAEIQGGFAFKSQDLGEVGIPVIKIGNVQDGFLDVHNCQRLPENVASLYEKFLIAETDILVTLTGHVGRVAEISDTQLPALLNQRVGRFSLKVFSPHLKAYLYWALRQPKIRRSWSDSSYGVAQPNISPKQLLATPLAVPPEEEQKRFVDFLSVAEGKRTEMHGLDEMCASLVGSLQQRAFRGDL